MKILILLFLISLPLLNLASEESADDSYRISLMTIGPGQPLYLWWGHIGLVVEDLSHDTSFFYDFGNFSFEEDNFYRNFAMGRLHYLSIRTRTEPYLRYMSFSGRKITLYRLNLQANEKRELVTLLEEGIRPENRTYLYDHYINNCSTRIRDLLDLVLNGHIRDNTEAYALTFRDQSNRFMGPFWGYIVLNYLQGPSVDTPISLWDALFLPQELEQVLDKMERPGGEALVSSKTVLYPGSENPVPLTPYPRLGEAFLWGMLLFMITIALRLWGGPRGEGFWGVFSLLLILLPGLLLFFMMTFTDHHVTYNNLNILITCPLLFLLWIPFKDHTQRKIRFHKYWDTQSLFVLIALLAGTLPGLQQNNLSIVLFYSPLYLAWGLPGSYLIGAIRLPKRSFKWSQKFLS